jgi:hypothetical protein
MLMMTGIVLLALGLFSGTWLVLSPLGYVEGEAGIALWLLFPGLSLAGYLMAASASEGPALPLLGRISGGLLVLLALGSAAALVMHAAGLAQASSTASLWFVLAFGLALGATAWASHGRAAVVAPREPDAAQSR